MSSTEIEYSGLAMSTFSTGAHLADCNHTWRKYEYKNEYIKYGILLGVSLLQ